MTITPIITPCTNEGKFPVCDLCRRSGWSFEERMERVRLYSANWMPDEDGNCDGLLTEEEDDA